MPESWWLKFKRAQHHMVDIRCEIRRYGNSNPYRFERVKAPRNRKGDLAYALRIEQPDPMLATVVGDFVHNLRTSLDHVIVACAPRSRKANASFPVVYKDLFQVDKNGKFIDSDDEARQRFRDAVYGCDPRVIALVIGVQPYQLGSESSRNIFGALSRLENADKHRALVTTAIALKHVKMTLSVGNASLPYSITRHEDDYLEDGAKVSFHAAAEAIGGRYPEVHMEGRGTPFITLEVSQVGGNQQPLQFDLQETLIIALREVRTLLRAIEPHARG